MKQLCGAKLTVWLSVALSVAACGDDADALQDSGPQGQLDGRVPGPPDAAASTMDSGRPDAGPAADASADSSAQDAGDDAGDEDAGLVDAAMPLIDSGPPCLASAAPSIPALKLEPVAGIAGMTRLVFAAQPTGSSDWYLVQQTGTIHLLSGGQLKATPFLDVSALITQELDFADERGLLSIAFPADYATSNKFYVAITPTVGCVSCDTVLEYERIGEIANPVPLRTIVQLPMSLANHNGGTLGFDRQGLLYYGTGDGGGGCNDNQPGAPQDVNTLFGKILRFDPLVSTPPFAAASNPFAAGSGDPRVLHYGLRNPFRWSIDRLTGDMYIGDVGQNLYEEEDFAPAGSAALNFGWPKYEGMHVDTCGPDKPFLPGSSYTPPIVDIARSADKPPPFGDWISTIGGRVYRGPAIPQLYGVYVYGDYLGKRMAALTQCGSTTSPVAAIGKNPDPNEPNAAAFAPAIPGTAPFTALTAIVEDSAGELYFVANRSSLLKVVPGP